MTSTLEHNLEACGLRAERLRHLMAKPLGFRPAHQSSTDPCRFDDFDGPTSLLDKFEPQAPLSLPPEEALLVPTAAAASGVLRVLRETSKRVVVFERYPALVERFLEYEDWTPWLGVGRLELVAVAAESFEEELALARRSLRHLRKRTELGLAGLCPWWQKVFDGEYCSWPTYPGLGIALEEAFPAAFQSSGLALVRNWQQSLAQDPTPMVFANVAADTAAIRTILKGLCDGFEAIGAAATLHVEAEGPDLHGRRLQAVLKAQPKLLLTAIKPASQLSPFLRMLADLPSVLYLTDAPWLAESYPAEAYANTLVATPEPQYGEWLAARVNVNAVPLPLAASYPAPPASLERQHRLCFIGNVADPEGQLSSLTSQQWQDLEERFHSQRRPDATGDLSAFCREAMRIANWRQLPCVDHVLWGTIYRVSYLAAIADLNPAVYGGQAWQRLLAFSGNEGLWRGWLEPEAELPRVMASHTLHINLTSLPNYFSGNMRTYDAAGLGCCVIHDHKRDVAAQFEEGREMLFFRDRDSLRSQCQWALGNESAARSIGASAAATVEREHRRECRAKQLKSLAADLHPPRFNEAALKLLFPTADAPIQAPATRRAGL